MYPFFMKNEILDIFSSNSFYEESNIFRENCEKKFFGDMKNIFKPGVHGQ